MLDKPTRARRDWQFDDDFESEPAELDRSVQTPEQIRTIACALRDNWKRDLFSQREEWPTTLVFSKEDNHAEANRNAALWTFGNLTIWTQGLNSSVSNRACAAKRPAILRHSPLPISQQLHASIGWNGQMIAQRGEDLLTRSLQLRPRA